MSAAAWHDVGDRLTRNDAGQHLLAAQVVGDGGTGDVAHEIVLAQDALHFGCRDVLAAAADHVLPAVDEEQIAVGVASHDVAGVEPAAFPCGFRRLRIAEVFGEEASAWIGAGDRTSNSPGVSSGASAPD